MYLNLAKCFMCLFFTLTAFGKYDLDVQVFNQFVKDLLPLDKDRVAFVSNASSKKEFRKDILKYMREVTADEHFSIFSKPYNPRDPYVKIIGDTAYVRIFDFKYSDSSFFEKALKFKNIVIDLRGNLGGNIQNVFDLYYKLGRKKKERNRVFPLFKTYYEKFIVHEISDKSAKDLNFIDSKSCISFDCKYSIHRHHFKEREKKKKLSVKNNVYAIYDDKCFSGCEIFLILSKTVNEVKTFSNSPSRGGYRYGGVLSVKLPISGLILGIPRTRRDFSGNFDGKGIKPDVNIGTDFDIKDFITKYVLKKKVI